MKERRDAQARREGQTGGILLTAALVFLLSGCSPNQDGRAREKVSAIASTKESCPIAPRPIPSGVADLASLGSVPDRGVSVFSYDPEANALSALICDSRLELFFAAVNPKSALKKLRFSRNPEREENRNATEAEKRCRVIWGPSFKGLEASRAQDAQAEGRNQVLWKAAMKFGVAQIPSTGLMIAAGALASVTVGSAFHEIVSALEAGQIGQAIQTFQSVDPSQVGWTGTSLMLFGFSRVASTLSMTKRVKVLLETKQALALSQFSEAYGVAFDEVVAGMSEQELLALKSDGEGMDGFMSRFAQTLNVKVSEARLSPRTVLLSLQALRESALPAE
ncbi:MAG: hypothetical protein IOD12_05655 [Silvanigrellales bacterium]|jgi:hypothetical protein|nr:hypothetical protein [Silvanigrellales bacterium]